MNWIIIEYVVLMCIVSITLACTILFRFIDSCRGCYIATVVLLPLNLALIILVCYLMCCHKK